MSNSYDRFPFSLLFFTPINIANKLHSCSIFCSSICQHPLFRIVFDVGFRSIFISKQNDERLRCHLSFYYLSQFARNVCVKICLDFFYTCILHLHRYCCRFNRRRILIHSNFSFEQEKQSVAHQWLKRKWIDEQNFPSKDKASAPFDLWKEFNNIQISLHTHHSVYDVLPFLIYSQCTTTSAFLTQSSLCLFDWPKVCALILLIIWNLCRFALLFFIISSTIHPFRYGNKHERICFAVFIYMQYALPFSLDTIFGSITKDAIHSLYIYVYFTVFFFILSVWRSKALRLHFTWFSVVGFFFFSFSIQFRFACSLSRSAIATRLTAIAGAKITITATAYFGWVSLKVSKNFRCFRIQKF